MKKLRHGKLLNGEVDKWSERHVGSLALTRTVLGFLNLLLAVVVVFKLFEVIWWQSGKDHLIQKNVKSA